MPKSNDNNIIISGGEAQFDIKTLKQINKINQKNKNKNKNQNKNKQTKNNKNNHSNKKKLKVFYRFIIFLFVVLIAVFGLLRYAEFKVRPIIASMAEAHARTIGARVVGEAINEEMNESNISYDDLVAFEKSADGHITALKTNILNVNKLKSKLGTRILNKLSSLDDINLYIPIGNLLNGEFLSGRGPKIEVILLPIGSVSSNITNAFSSAGINQTRHQIILEVRVTVSVIMPFSVESTDIINSVSIAETIIVGNVPETYLSGSEGGESKIAIVP